jgi:WD40 repeat protein
MKTLSILITSYLLLGFGFAAFADRGGSEGGGGGDRCEDRFKVVAQDLKDWINAGGPNGLILTGPQGSISAVDYSKSMLAQINQIHITCVSPGDVGYPVVVGGQAKECRSERDANGSEHITCDRAKFYTALQNPENDPVQYKIVHHELATLAGFEVPTAGDSQYWVSDQISGFLTKQTVFKLAVNPAAANEARVGDISIEADRRHGFTGDLGIASPDKKHFAYLSRTGVTVIDLITYQRLFTVNTSADQTRTLYSPDGSVLCVNDGLVPEWKTVPSNYECVDANNGTPLYKLPQTLFVIFSPDTRLVFSMSPKGSVEIHDAKTGQSLKKFQLPAKVVKQLMLNGAAISPDGILLVVPTQDKKKHAWINVFDAHTGQVKFTLSGGSASFSKDGAKIATAVDDGRRTGASVYDAKTGQELKFLDNGGTDSVDFLPNGKLMSRHLRAGSCSTIVYGLDYKISYLGECSGGNMERKVDPAGTFFLGDAGDHDTAFYSLNTGHILASVDLSGPSYISEVLSEDRVLFYMNSEKDFMSPVIIRIMAIPPM